MYEDTADPAMIQQAQLDRQREMQAWSVNPDPTAADRLQAAGVPLSTTPLDGNSAEVDINGKTYFYRQTDLTADQRSLVSEAGDPYGNVQERATRFNSYAATPAGQQAASQAASANGDQNAYQTLVGMFRDQGLESLAPTILSLLQQGYDATAISYLLRQTPEYKARFSGNDARVKSGLAPLSPSEYLAAERAYKQIFSSYGLPNGFYDSQSKLADLIGRDVSPTEINDRVKSAVDFVNNADPLKRQELAMYFPELGTGDIVANFLDPKEAKPLLDKKIAATAIGYQAARQGLASPSVGDALKYADQGVNEDQARQAYGTIADMLPTEQAIGQRFHQQFGQTDAEQELLGGLASARRKRDSLNNSEEALFAGSSGLSSDSLKRSQPGSY